MILKENSELAHFLIFFSVDAYVRYPKGRLGQIQSLLECGWYFTTPARVSIEFEGIMKMMWDFEGVKNPEVKFSQNKTKGIVAKERT